MTFLPEKPLISSFMDRFAVGGLSLHEADFEGLERAKRRAEGARNLADALGASELVVLSTCNRLEVVYARETGHRPGREDLPYLRTALGLDSDPLGEKLFHHAGKAAARHLLRVTASLDSLVVGEDQILGQVRQAFETSRRLGLTGPVLGPLFESAVQLGKQVRSKTDLSRHPVSVVSLAVRLMQTHVERNAVIGILGAGETAQHALKSLVQNGYTIAWIANRTKATAIELARSVGAEAVDMERVRKGEVPADAIVAATSSKEPLLSPETLASLAERTPGRGPLTAVDLALPRDLDIPASFVRITDEGQEVNAPGLLVDLEALRILASRNEDLRQEAAGRAETMIEEKLERLLGRGARGSKLVAKLLEEARGSFELELNRLFRGRLAHLSEEDRRSVERWARTTFGRLAHSPTKVLQDLAQRVGEEGDAADESALSA